MKYGLIAFSAFAVTALVGGCATQRADGQAKRPMSSTIGTKTSVNEAGEEIICKRDYATGSRVKYNEICGRFASFHFWCLLVCRGIGVLSPRKSKFELANRDLGIAINIRRLVGCFYYNDRDS